MLDIHLVGNNHGPMTYLLFAHILFVYVNILFFSLSMSVLSNENIYLDPFFAPEP